MGKSKAKTLVTFATATIVLIVGMKMVRDAKKEKKGLLEDLLEDVKVQFPKEHMDIEKKAAALLREYKAKEKGKSHMVTMHTVKRIYPCIAVYKAIIEMTGEQEEAYQLIEDYFARGAKKASGAIQKICKIPMVYPQVPCISKWLIKKFFGEKSGFKMEEQETDKRTCHVDMLECPYNNTCTACGCKELTPAFCNSDDIAYGSMHPKLFWERTTTLGRGDECCNFIIRAK